MSSTRGETRDRRISKTEAEVIEFSEVVFHSKMKKKVLTLLHSSLVAVEQRVQPGAVIHHKHSSLRPLGGNTALTLNVQRHLNSQPSVGETSLIVANAKRRCDYEQRARRVDHLLLVKCRQEER